MGMPPWYPPPTAYQPATKVLPTASSKLLFVRQAGRLREEVEHMRGFGIRGFGIRGFGIRGFGIR
jgi:hypothetical protein